MFLWVALFLSPAGCEKRAADPRARDVDERLSRLEQVSMHFDARSLPPRRKEVLKALVDATGLIHEAFLHQYYPPGIALRDSLAKLTDGQSRKLYRLVVRNGGPFDKMDQYANFFDATPRAPGAAVYPSDLTRGEFEAYVATHPGQKDALMSPYTAIRREGGILRAVPYHEAYQEWVRPAAELLAKAASLADNPSLTTYMISRADALLSDDYFAADTDWINLKGSDIDFYIAPYEVYEDHLMGIKAFYDGSVGIVDSVESSKLQKYTSYLDELERNLPCDGKYKRTRKGLLSPMVVLNEVTRGGALSTGYQAVASTLPNDPKVTSVKGTKKVFWKNVMDARVNRVIEPIGRALLASDQIPYVTAQAVLDLTTMHELCHALGPKYVFGTGDSVSVNQALKDLYTPIEEGKATLAGLHSIYYLEEKGVMGKEMEYDVSYLAVLFLTIRFGTAEAHSKAAICQLNFLRDRGGIRLDPVTKKWSVNPEKLRPAISEMAGLWLTFEATGDYHGVAEFFRSWSPMPRDVQEGLEDLHGLPVDIEPVYSIQWE